MDIEDQPSPTHLLPDRVKWEIVFCHQRGDTNKNIARTLGVKHKRSGLCHQTVKSIIDKFTETGTIDNNWSKTGRPKVIDEETKEELINHCVDNRFKSVNEHKRDLDIPCSRQTINRALLENGYGAYSTPKRIVITATNLEKRLRFAERFLHWRPFDWHQILFSDESRFPLINANGRLLCRRRPEEALQDDTVQPSDYFSGTIMVWGVISPEGVGPLVWIQENMDGDVYLDTLRYRLGRCYPKLLTGELVWQEDNAKPHNATQVREWFRNKGIKALKWPSQSPDLNIIEDVWNMMKFQLKGRTFDTKESLWDEVYKQWKAITKEQILSLYDSLPRRMEAVRAAEGGFTKY